MRKVLLTIYIINILFICAGCARYEDRTTKHKIDEVPQNIQKNVEKNKITNRDDLTVIVGDKPCFIIKDEMLYGWRESSYSHSYLVDKGLTKMMEGVDTVQYQDDLFDDVHSDEYDAKMLYVMRTDGSFWMRGYDSCASRKVKHNYKELTQVIINVKSFYKKPGPAVYVVKKDNSLWFWNKYGVKMNGKNKFDFFKVMDNVKSVSVGGNIDYVIKKDGSLYAINMVRQGKKYSYSSTYEKLLDKVTLCKVKYSMFNIYHVAYAIDKKGKLWAWGTTNEKDLLGKYEFSKPKIIFEDTDDIVFYGNTETSNSEVYAIKKDKSLWLLSSGYLLENPIKITNQVDRFFVIDRGHGRKKDVKGTNLEVRDEKLLILKHNGKLYEFNLLKDTKRLIEEDVDNVGVELYSDKIWILKNNHTLVNVEGDVLIDNIIGIYNSEEYGFGFCLALSHNKVFRLERGRIFELFEFSE